MQKKIAEIAYTAQYEATQEVDKAIGKGLFIFRAQILLEENEELLPEEKFDAVLSNSDAITAIIAREQSLSQMDEIHVYLSDIRNLVRAASDNGIDTSGIKKRVRAVEGQMSGGNLFKIKKELVEILEEYDNLKEQVALDWTKYIITELHEKMDGMIKLYKNFPNQFMGFEENPIHILTSYLEDIMAETDSYDHQRLEKSFLDFYLFYSQVDRFLKEEQDHTFKGKKLSITKLTIEEKELEPYREPATVNGMAETEPLPETANPEIRTDDDGSMSFVPLLTEKNTAPAVLELLETIPVEELVEVVEAVKEKEALEKAGAEDEDAEGPGRPEESASDKADDLDTFDEEPPDFSNGDEITLSSGVSYEKGKVVAMIGQDEPPAPKVVMNIKRKTKKKGKKLPSFGSVEDRGPGEDRAKTRKPKKRAVVRKKKTKSEERILPPVEMIKPKEVAEEPLEMPSPVSEDGEPIGLKEYKTKLEALALKAMVNKKYENAIAYYDKILEVDPDDKNVYKKRDECYSLVFYDMRDKFSDLMDKAVEKGRRARGF